jgi:hypothetical protein
MTLHGTDREPTPGTGTDRPFAGTDPRRRDDGIGWVTRAVFPDPRVRLTLGRPPRDGRGPLAGGHRVVARYAVVPSVSRARFLLPLVSRRVTAASVLAYNALRPPKLRAARAVLGTLARLGILRAAPLRTLTVAIPSDVDPAEVLLPAHVANLINQTGRGGEVLHAALGVRPPDPNHKPTLQVFDGAGRPRGYAKIGWNDATRALVRAEIQALRELAADPPFDRSAGVVVPRLLAASEWNDLVIAVVEPLPAGIRGVDPAEPPAVDAMLSLARKGNPGPGRDARGEGPGRAVRAADSRLAFGASAFAARVLREAGESGSSEAVRVVTALRERDRGTVLEFGEWHGDWVPWNLGRDRRDGGRLVVWDWEHRGTGVPVGFDLVHQGFQTALTLGGAPAAQAVAAAEALVGRHGSAFGLGAVERRLVVDAYLVELWLRTWRLAAGGGGWNGALHPALLEVLGRRLGV